MNKDVCKKCGVSANRTYQFGFCKSCILKVYSGLRSLVSVVDQKRRAV